MDYRVTSGPLSDEAKLAVVTLEDVKRAERIAHTEEDAFINQCIVGAFDFFHGAQGWLNGYYLLEETIEVFFPVVENTVEISARPLVKDSELVLGRLGDDGAYAAISQPDYAPFRRDECLVLAALSDTAFPIVSGVPKPRTYRVTCKVGHADAASVPSPLKRAITLLASHHYQHREATSDAKASEIPFGVKALAGQYRFSPDHS